MVLDSGTRILALTHSILARSVIHLFFGINLSLNGIIVFLAWFLLEASQIFKSQSAKNENSSKSTNTKWIVNLALASSPHDQWWIKWEICCFFGCNKPWLNSSTCVRELHYLLLSRKFFIHRSCLNLKLLLMSACNFSESMWKFKQDTLTSLTSNLILWTKSNLLLFKFLNQKKPGKWKKQKTIKQNNNKQTTILVSFCSHWINA